MRVFLGLILFFSLATGGRAQAQWLGPDLAFERPQTLMVQPGDLMTLGKGPGPMPVIDPNKRQLAEAIALALKAQWQVQLEPLKRPEPQCAAPAAGAYALALKTKGEIEQCRDYALRCLTSSATTNPRLTFEGAQCAAGIFDHASAHRLFDVATQTVYQNEEFFELAVFQFASYAYYSPYQAEATAILQRAPQWSPAERTLLQALIEKTGQGRTALATGPEIENYLESKTSKRSGYFEDLLRTMRVQILQNDFEHDRAYARLSLDFAQFSNPLNWYLTAFEVFYTQDAANFKLAQILYDAYLPFMHAHSRLPLEQNVYNYSELYQSVCHDQLLQDVAFGEFSQLKKTWREGAVSEAEFTRRLDQLDPRGDRADVMTVRGALAFNHQDFATARSAYWKAHELCPYYNRAHWGLALVTRQIRFESFPDHDELLDKMNKVVDGLSFPKVATDYFLNWSSLPLETQRRVTYGARIWANYVDSLYGANKRTYIKFAFDLMSEVPGWGMVRDERIPYANDNRLWDDVRGLGGDIVVADLVETSQTVFGAYNLLGHEMAHQFHQMVSQRAKPIDRCNAKLFAGATARGTFPDGYSAQNPKEYFAQGVTYYLVPEDSHPRFGLNRKWLVANDPDQLKFIESIIAAKGDLPAVGCPL